MAYDFHYTPTGSGAISGQQVLQQTEDAINELGDYVNDNVGGAMDVAQQALTNSANAVDDAQTALNTANNAKGVAIQAQNDVSNLSGTVTNIGNRVTTAEGNIGNLQGRMTTAEGNIGNLQGRMATAEGNIGNLQTAVSTAQATANSAQQTATTARQQSYVFRYSSTALVASSTNSNTLLDNTDNLKVGDKVIDSSGVLFSITAIDTANSTFSIGTALIDLANDSDVMHLSGDETAAGEKTFSNMSSFQGSYLGTEESTNARTDLVLESNKDTHGQSGIYIKKFRSDKPQGGLTGSDVVYVTFDVLENSVRTNNALRFNFRDFVNNAPTSVAFYPTGINNSLGGSVSATNKWTKINGVEPSSLGMPDLSNGIDISGYITNFGAGTVNEYTPVADGWISIANSGDSPIFIRVYNDYGFEQVAYSERNEVGGTTGGTYSRFGSLMIPCIKNVKIYIIVSPTSSVLVSAKFFPCLGNV